MRKQNDPAHVVMPGVHRVASLLQRWLLGTHQGGVSPDHLDAYLSEFTFRFNRRHARRRGMLFYRLLEQSIVADPITYSSLIANPRATGRQARPPSRPGRVASVPEVYRPWRQTPKNTGSPDLMDSPHSRKASRTGPRLVPNSSASSISINRSPARSAPARIDRRSRAATSSHKAPALTRDPPRSTVAPAGRPAGH